MKAIWNNAVIAQSRDTLVVENNHYFPPDSVKSEYLQPAIITTTCPWKGVANYFDIVVEGKTNQQAAWIYREPKKEAEQIKGYIAFWRGVEVVEE